MKKKQAQRLALTKLTEQTTICQVWINYAMDRAQMLSKAGTSFPQSKILINKVAAPEKSRRKNFPCELTGKKSSSTGLNWNQVLPENESPGKLLCTGGPDWRQFLGQFGRTNDRTCPTACHYLTQTQQMKKRHRHKKKSSSQPPATNLYIRSTFCSARWKWKRPLGHSTCECVLALSTALNSSPHMQLHHTWVPLTEWRRGMWTRIRSANRKLTTHTEPAHGGQKRRPWRRADSGWRLAHNIGLRHQWLGATASGHNYRRTQSLNFLMI